MSDNKKFIQAQQFQLAGSGVSLSDTTIVLKKFKLQNSNANITSADLGTTCYATLEAGSAREESISFPGANVTQNADGTATITGVTRGLKFVSPYDQDLTLRKGHGGGTSFVITNAPGFYNEFASKLNDETIEQIWSFVQNPQKTTDVLAVSNRDFVTKNDLIAAALGTLQITGTVVSGTAGEAIVLGKVCYLKASDNRWYKADAATTATFDTLALGVAQSAPGAAGVAMTVLPFGIDSNQSGLTPGAKYYLSDTAGNISTTPGTFSVFLGWAITASQLLFVRNNDVNSPTAREKAAMVGSSGTPSASNKFITEADPTTTSTANKIVRADSDGKIDSLWLKPFRIIGDFFAGENLTANDAVVLSPSAQTDGGVKHDTSVTTTLNQSNPTINVANNPNRILVVDVSDSALTGVTANGSAMTLLQTYSAGGAYGTLKRYWLAAPPTGTVTVSFTGGYNYAVIRSLYNCSQSAPTQFSTASSGSTGNLTNTSPTPSNVNSVMLLLSSTLGNTSGAVSSSIASFDTNGSPQQHANNVGSTTICMSSAISEIKYAATAITAVSGHTITSGFCNAQSIGCIIAPANPTATLGILKASAASTINGVGSMTNVIGFVYATKTSGATDVKIYSPDGEIPGFSGLTSGSIYYLSNTYGAISTTAGTTSKKVGLASASTKLIPLIN